MSTFSRSYKIADYVKSVLIFLVSLWSVGAMAGPDCGSGDRTSGIGLGSGWTNTRVADDSVGTPSFLVSALVGGDCTRLWNGTVAFGIQLDYQAWSGKMASHNFYANSLGVGPMVCYQFPMATALCAKLAPNVLDIHLHDRSYQLGAIQRDLSLQQSLSKELGMALSHSRARYGTGGPEPHSVETSTWALGLTWTATH